VKPVLAPILPQLRQGWRTLRTGGVGALYRSTRSTGSGRLQGRRGFTLVELLVVLAVVTVLIAFLMPVLWTARNRGRTVTCVNNLHQLGVSLNLYTQDWEDTLPDAPGTGYADGLLDTYIQDFKELRGTLRPTQSTYIRGVLSRSDSALKGPIFQCPNDVGRKNSGAETYGFINGSVYELAQTSYLWDPVAQPQFLAEDNAGSPTAQSVNGKYLGELNDTSVDRLLQDYGALWHTTLGSPTERQVANGTVNVLHGQVNVLYADFHVGHETNTTVQPVASLGPDPTIAATAGKVSGGTAP
jgi:prepilin-type N-terminal cleavage/methylation domain-containing protein/prepilin-type processing-associated H-X9-DG protein